MGHIQEWESKCYFDGIPDEVPVRIQQLLKAPSYKAICVAILKNDYALKTLGFARVKSQIYNTIKKQELMQRGVIKSSNQLKFF